ncbi:hypothetical protein HD554DRAFT_2028255 [Boletus coccyginus]|nr:hypothetical protein HD554DRAFT_2028255 [Boletus coccyginus]
MLLITGAAYNQCTGCSESKTILHAYEREGFGMLLRAFNESRYLEALTGLDQLYEQGEGVIESNWQEEESE